MSLEESDEGTHQPLNLLGLLNLVADSPLEASGVTHPAESPISVAESTEFEEDPITDTRG